MLRHDTSVVAAEKRDRLALSVRRSDPRSDSSNSPRIALGVHPGEPQFTFADIERDIGPRSLSRARTYAERGRVSKLAFEHGGRVITARVRGSDFEPYRVRISITPRKGDRAAIDGACTCPMDYNCKHVAAVLLVVLEHSRRVAPPEDHDDPRVDVWLDSLRESAIDDASVPRKIGAERTGYIFAAGALAAGRAFGISIVVIKRAPNDSWKMLRTTHAVSLSAASARSVLPHDAIIGRLVLAYEGARRGRARLANDIVERILETPFAYLESVAGLHLTRGPARAGRVEWRLAEDGLKRPVLTFDDERLARLPAPAPWYVDRTTGESGPVESDLGIEALATLLESPPLSAREISRVRSVFARDLPALALPAPPESIERTVREPPVPLVRLRHVRADSGGRHYSSLEAKVDGREFDIAEFSFAYGPLIADPADRSPDLRAVSAIEATTYVRDLDAERLLTARLAVYDLENDPLLRTLVPGTGLVLRFPDGEEFRWGEILHAALPELLAEGWRVDVDDDFGRRVVDLSNESAWTPRASDTGDGWFDLALGIDVEGKRYDLLAILSDLLSRSGLGSDGMLAADVTAQTYYLGFGENLTVALPGERIRAIVETLAELGDPHAVRNGRLRLPRIRAGVLGDLEAAANLRFDASAALRKLADRLHSFDRLARVAVPKTFRGKLRPYQRHGLDWLQFLATHGLGGILADDMGLGKSVQTLAHLLCEKQSGRLESPVLLVVPTSLVYNWIDEAARFAPSLRVLSLHGPTRFERFEDIGRSDLVITTYALLSRDAMLAERRWHAVIFDEAQAIKNPLSKGAQAAAALEAGHRLCLTGTPVENHLGDLWSLFSIALPGLLGDRKSFGNVFRTPIEKRGNASRGRALTARIAPFLLRRTKEIVAGDLPPKTEIVQRVELIGAQRDLYEAVRLAMSDRVRKEIAERGLARSQIVILDALLKLRQVCCDPRLLPTRTRKNVESAKLAMLLEMLPQMVEEGRRILLFSQFTSMLDLIVPELESREIDFVTLTGATRDRGSIVKRFQSGEVPVFLVSLKAGGTGLNLTAADTVIHYDPWWNPAVERQATDRAHRIGQDKHVFVYKLICAGTVEEKIVAMQSRKAELAAAIFTEKASGSAAFGSDDVKRLFAPIDDRST